MTGKFEALDIPPDALEQGGVEVLRAAIVDGAVSFALRRSFDDPGADASQRLLLAHLGLQRVDARGLPGEEEALARIRAGIEADGLARGDLN